MEQKHPNEFQIEDYDFNILLKWMQHEYLYPKDLLADLDTVFESVENLEKLVVLNPETSKALIRFGTFIKTLANSFPEELR